MSAANPSDYAWLSAEGFALRMAGCITVVPGAERARTAAAFGSDLAAPVSEPDLGGDYAAFPAGAGGTIAIEDNGYQGTREAVLARASKTAANRRAASIFWNVNGVVQFTCAAKGELVASVELGFVDDPDDLPRVVRKLAALGEDAEADLVAIGAAMVATYTGTGFTPGDLAAPLEWFLLEPPLDVLPIVTEESASLAHWVDENSAIPLVLAGIGTLDDVRRRRLAHWIAAVAFEQAALGDDGERYQRLVAGLDGVSAQPAPQRLILYMQKVDRVWTAGHDELASSHPRWFPHRSLQWLGQVHLMGVALRYAGHPDAATAAWEAVYHASRSLGFPGDRGTTAAGGALYPAVLAFIQAPEMTKADFIALFPDPPSTDDRRRYLAEEFAVYERRRREHEEEWSELGEGWGDGMGPIEPYVLPR